MIYNAPCWQDLSTKMQKRWNPFTEMIETLYILAFSCRIPSCHNLEYESPWDSRHSGSLGGLKCLPFLYDMDPVNKHILENTDETLLPNSIFHSGVNKFLKGKKAQTQTNPLKQRWLNMSKADHSQKKNFWLSPLFKIHWFLKMEGPTQCWGTYWHFQLKSKSHIPLGRLNQYVNQSYIT